MPLLVYAATGSSRQLAVGPVAIISLLTKASLSYIDPESPDYTKTYVTAAITLAFLSGLVQVCLKTTLPPSLARSPDFREETFFIREVAREAME